MRIEQLSQILDQGKTDKATVSNTDRMSHAIRKVLNEDMKNPRRMSFTEMVNRYL